MKKTTRRIKTWKYVVSLTLSVLCILGSLFIEATAAVFVLKSIDIQNAEAEGKAYTHNANGYVTWTETEIEKYNNAVAAKNELINTNDVAKFFSDLAGSTTGQIFRVIVPVALVGVLYISTKLAYAAICILPRRFYTWLTEIAYPTLAIWKENFCKWWKSFSVKVKTHLSKETAKLLEKFNKKRQSKARVTEEVK